MADFDMVSTIVNDERPIAVRKKRRSSVGRNMQSISNVHPRSAQPHGICTPPATPKKSKKRVRFSDPGPEIESESASSGLTPFIRRTSLSSTPTSKRRHSTPAKLWNRAEYNDTPVSGTLQFAPLRQVLEGRVVRRIKRNRLSEEINKIQLDKRNEARERKSEVERLRHELAAKDLEVQSMRDEQDIASQIGGESGVSMTTNTTLSLRIQELEQEVRNLKAELERKEDETEDDPNWTMAARDPFNFEDNDDNMITNYDDDFDMNDDMITTPTRLNTSFPSPPSTMPNTPCKSTSSTSAGIQASLPIHDAENEQLKTQLKSLQTEIMKLTSAVAFNEDNHTRLAEKLAEFIPTDESRDYTTLDSALDTVLTQLALSQSHALERDTAFSALSNEISSLGFPVSSPDKTLEIISKQFRQARLDLEYLTPGEVVEGFENDKLLEMLVSRIKVLLEKFKDSESSIDQYHEQELLLRQQINTRVDVMDSMKKEIFLANNMAGDLREEIKEKEISNDRLKEALDGYRDEVRSLEILIERMEQESSAKEQALNGQISQIKGKLQDEALAHDTTRADNEGKSLLITELEKRLSAAMQSAAQVQAQLNSFSTAQETAMREKGSLIEKLTSSASERERQHGDALVLRDARVSELRAEIERVNKSLKEAHQTILSLRKENQELGAQLDGEKTRSSLVINRLRDGAKSMLDVGEGYINGDLSVLGPSRSEQGLAEGLIVGESQADSRRGSSVRREPSPLFDAGLARRKSGNGKKRRRYDSGLGFLEEEDESVLTLDFETPAVPSRTNTHS